MNFELTDEQKMIKDTVKEFADKEIKPRAKAIDEEGEFPWDIIEKLSGMGLMGMTVPTEYGGSGVDRISYMLALEEVGRACGSTGLTMEAHNSLGIGHLYAQGTEEQRKKYIPDMAAGKVIGAWALTEPSAGSDAGATKTTAVLEGDEWVLNGSKIFITSADVAGVTTVMARTDEGKGPKGISAFIVEKDTPGVTIGKKEDKLGLRGSTTTEIFYEDCRIPKENLLGERGMGFIGAMKTLEGGRAAIGALAVGIAQAALDECLVYAEQRVQFGKPIGSFQAIQWMIADMATEIEAARLLVHKAAWLEDNDKAFGKEAAMAKLFAATRGIQVCLNAIQVHGGYGYTKEYPVERFLRDMKLMEIGEGTNEVQRMVIARYLMDLR